ncbi:MAG: hypothetical protein RIS75_135 [Actinomycetota bacterium]|jgi:ribosomal protein S18 acetylase RimI-like enzyme
MTRHSGDSKLRITYGVHQAQLLEISELFDQAFAGKFKYAIPDAQLRIEFWSEILNSDQIFTAYVDGELAGIALLTFEAHSGFLPTAQKTLFRNLGLKGGIRAAFYFALYSKLDSKILNPAIYLEALSVSEKFRGMGLGSALIDEIVRFGIANGYKSLTLKVTLENTSAQRLYEKLGFSARKVSKTPILAIFTKVSGATTMELELRNQVAQ